MTRTFKVVERFGPLLANGNEGNLFRMIDLQCALHECESVILDFAGVENMTDSFANACFANLAADHREDVRRKLRFANCTNLVRSFILAALSRGFREAASRFRVAH